MRSKKTIGFTIHSLHAGGAERVVTSLANALVESYNVKIISLEKGVSFYELNSEIEVRDCDLNIPEEQHKIGAIKTHIKTVKTLSKFIKEESIDLLIGFTTSVNVLTLIAAKLNTIPVIISERNNPIADPPNSYWKFLRNSLYRFSNYLVVQTAPNKAFFSKLMPSKKIIIIKNPIAPSLTSKRVIRNQIAKHQTILTVGRLDTNKAQDLLIKAFANLPNTHGWKLEIIGDGHKLKAYKALVKDLGIEESVHFIGNVSNIYDYYNKASIFVFTSKSEGYPNALAEALYFGLPSISTNCPHGPADLITNNHNGLLIDVDDQKMLEIELNKLMTDENLRFQLSKNAIANSDALNMSLITAAWKKCFSKLL